MVKEYTAEELGISQPKREFTAEELNISPGKSISKRTGDASTFEKIETKLGPSNCANPI
jgi:hypothetical protein